MSPLLPIKANLKSLFALCCHEQSYYIDPGLKLQGKLIVLRIVCLDGAQGPGMLLHLLNSIIPIRAKIKTICLYHPTRYIL